MTVESCFRFTKMWKELQAEVDQLPEAGPQKGQLFAARRGLDRQPARALGKQVAIMLILLFQIVRAYK